MSLNDIVCSSLFYSDWYIRLVYRTRPLAPMLTSADETRALYRRRRVLARAVAGSRPARVWSLVLDSKAGNIVLVVVVDAAGTCSAGHASR